jgi:hypothetical protein
MKVSTILAQPPRALSSRGFWARIRAWLMDEVTAEEARRRIRSHPGYLETLSLEALDYMRNYDGPENMGPPLSRRERRQMAERLSSM